MNLILSKKNQANTSSCSASQQVPLSAKNRLNKSALALTLAIAVSSIGCSSNSSTSADAGAALSDSSNGFGVLNGTWSFCNGSAKNTYTFSGKTWKQYYVIYDGSDCTGGIISNPGELSSDGSWVSGTFEIVGTTTTEDGLEAHLFNITTDANLGTPMFSSLISTRYDIVYSGVENQLLFGDNIGYSEDKRPAALDFDEVYFRR